MIRHTIQFECGSRSLKDAGQMRLTTNYSTCSTSLQHLVCINPYKISLIFTLSVGPGFSWGFAKSSSKRLERL